jgi:hypothetical protein
MRPVEAGLVEIVGERDDLGDVVPELHEPRSTTESMHATDKRLIRILPCFTAVPR